MIAHLQRMSCRLLLVAVAMLLCASIARAQIAHEGPAKAIALAATLQPYDVVSIKENKSGDQSGYVNIDDRGIFTVMVPTLPAGIFRLLAAALLATFLRAPVCFLAFVDLLRISPSLSVGQSQQADL